MLERRNFGRFREFFEMPHMLDLQRQSYEEFLQLHVPRTRRKDQGLESAFREVFPIESSSGEHKLEYLSYSIGNPKYDVYECGKRGMTYAGSLKVKLRLTSAKETKEQEVYLGDIPLMTDTGTFIVNGDERVVVSQLHRSPGISFEEEMHPTGKKIYYARIIPYRGAWIEFVLDINDILYVVVDRRRRFVATQLLRVFGLSTDEQISKAFSGVDRYSFSRESQLAKLVGKTVANEIVDPKSGEMICELHGQIAKEIVPKIWNAGIRAVDILMKEYPEIIESLKKDHSKNEEEAAMDMYRKLRPGDPPTLESARNLIARLFFDAKRYDLGTVGRYMLNRKLDMNEKLVQRLVNKETLLRVIMRLIDIKKGEGSVDDIDHLGNRRVRSVGELLLNQIRIGLVRTERAARERMNLYDLESVMPHNLINSKLISSVIRDFFGRSQLSQFMDQVNPLAELTHKRRLSALGPGGLNRERAGFEVRDVHYSHYGRMCPIETPEGPNIGLIASLSTFARINEFGFIEAPYRKVIEGRVTDKVDYMTADIEDMYIVAQANAKLDSKGNFTDKKIFCRYRDDFIQAEPHEIQYMDVSPRELVSVAAGIIPFLEHDDANRALMGSNMQRQAVPLIEPEVALIATGLEYRTAKDSGATVVAKSSGTVTAVDGNEIIVGGESYKLRKFERSNASTCINQRPIVEIGQKVKEGDTIADGPGTKEGELALGRNVLVAFMPWRGYNFEDAIILSEKMLKEDVYTSIHIEEFEIEARDTRLGNEEITRDIPNVGDEALKNLDEGGIVRIGAEVEPGDILVGKVTPKSETELSPEEKLLRAIFGEKAGDVKDASLTVPPGTEGIVIDVRVFARRESRSKTKEEKTREFKEVQAVEELYEAQIQKLKDEKLKKLHKILVGKKPLSGILEEKSGKVLIGPGKTIKADQLEMIADKADLENIKLANDPEAEQEITRVVRLLDNQMEELVYELDREIEKVKRGDELPPGVLKKVKVYVAAKRKVQVGDKMAGRHGNKGVVAKIVPEEDMPFLEDGTPVEIVLNPLGVPSRMNVGQILETHLGWAAKILGLKIASPVFDGATEAEIKAEMRKAKLPENGKVELRDGFTGRAYDQPVTVGYIYMMKLAHMVDDKIHARSIGPYSLVTQQPLGGKAQFGGQRFGEMEVWALEAYGAAYTLQELLTIKSDDVIGRTKIYESIVKGETTRYTGTPESFNVLIKELQSLCLDVKMEMQSEKNA